MTLPVTVRLNRPDDMARIFSDYLRSYRGAAGMKAIPNEIYFWWQHRIAESFWVDPTCVFLVACGDEDPTKIYGWLLGQRAESLAGDQVILHYVYVAKLYRRMGLATRLVATFDTRPNALATDWRLGQHAGDKGPLVITHRTDVGRELLEPLYDTLVYNPYLAWARAPALGAEPPKAVLKKKDPVAASRRELAFAGFPKEDGQEEEGT